MVTPQHPEPIDEQAAQATGTLAVTGVGVDGRAAAAVATASSPGTAGARGRVDRAGPRWLGMVVILSTVTLGLYFIVWFGLTWSEMKRELKDDSMSPVWHALSLLVPIYGWCQVHKHFQTINDLDPGTGTVRPGLVVALLVAAWVVHLVTDLPAQLLVMAGAAVYGQAALNSVWEKRAPAPMTTGPVTAAAHGTEPAGVAGAPITK